jgi:bifunctional DNA-binding transcriptional regulator/antitoxin component of YhaV-PrlF toxin-antitoxin module
VDDVVRFKVSASGQISLPADARRRWGVPNGGTVEVVDLGWGVLVVPPGGTLELRGDLLPSPAEHAAFVAGLDDPDLATT